MLHFVRFPQYLTYQLEMFSSTCGQTLDIGIT